jgi:beta-glucosidase
MQRLRAAGARNLGIVLNLIPVLADDPSMQSVADHVDRLQNGLFLDLLAGRGISPALRESCGSVTDWSFVRDEDLPVIATPLDWLGENYYTVMRVAAPSATATDAVGQDSSMFPACPPMTFAPRPPLTDMGWEVVPEGLGMALRRAATDLPGVPLWVCENGAAVPEQIDASGVHDPLRIDYLDRHIAQVLRTRDEGVDVRGYFAWSLLDNLEWASGWTKRFGVVRVDPTTGLRTAKDSAYWYRDRIARREV